MSHDSPRATPPNAVGPGAHWPTTQQLLTDVLGDVRSAAARGFLLREDTLADARMLTCSPVLSRARPYTSRSVADRTRSPEASAFNETTVGFFIPHEGPDADNVHNDIELGLFVDSFARVSPGHGFVRRVDRVHHCVTNKRKRKGVCLSYDRDVSSVELTFSQISASRFAYSVLVFDRTLFINALMGDPSKLDLPLLQRALRSTVVGDALPKTPRGALGWNGMPLFIPPGDFDCKNVFIRYKDGLPQVSFHVYTHSDISHGAHLGAVQNITTWAVRDLLSHATPTAQYSISERNGEENGEYSTSAGDDSVCTNPGTDMGSGSSLDRSGTVEYRQSPECVQDGNMKAITERSSKRRFSKAVAPLSASGVRKPVVIAPASDSASRPESGVSYAEVVDQKLRERLERRRIRNREAATRSNARRSALRKKARLAKENQNHDRSLASELGQLDLEGPPK